MPFSEPPCEVIQGCSIIASAKVGEEGWEFRAFSRHRWGKMQAARSSL